MDDNTGVDNLYGCLTWLAQISVCIILLISLFHSVN